MLDLEVCRTKKIHEWLTEDIWTKGINYVGNNGARYLSPENVDYYGLCKMCLQGAILLRYPEYYDVMDMIKSKLSNNQPIAINITMWNDAEHRTFEEVHALCKELDI